MQLLLAVNEEGIQILQVDSGVISLDEFRFVINLSRAPVQVIKDLRSRGKRVPYVLPVTELEDWMRMVCLVLVGRPPYNLTELSKKLKESSDE